MDHVAIMNKSWKLIEKIESGEKIIESRWYKFRRDPWNNISNGDTIYFKNSGEPVFLRADVKKVLRFDNLDKNKILELLHKYGNKIALSGSLEMFAQDLEGKKYCILIYLTNPQRIKPFLINKKGYGISSAWLVVNDIRKIKPN